MTSRPVRALPVAALLSIVLVAPAAAAAVINGTDGPDVLVGTPRADTIRGYAGNDTIKGQRGADQIYGGHGADQLFPGTDARKDVLRGGPGPDRIVGKGLDTVYAGGGNDTVVLRHPPFLGFATVKVYCGPGRDRVFSPFGGWLIGGNSGCEVWID